MSLMSSGPDLLEREAPRATAPSGTSAVAYLSPPATCHMADEWYDFAVEHHFWFQWRLAAMQKLLGSAGVAEPALEVGCGNAATRNQLEAALRCCIDGCDLNALALERAAPGRGQLYCYDICDRRSEWEGRFASVLILDTLEHIAEPVPFLKAAAYHMQPGGRMLITVPAHQWLYSRYDRAAGHVKRYSVSVMRRELAAAGLEIERCLFWALSLVPIVALRMLVMRFCRPDRTIATGFQPGSRLVDRVLRSLMWSERTLGTRMPTGASLVVLARRGDAQ